MKIEKIRKEFNPIIITFETEEEVEAILSITGSIEGKGKIRKITDELYCCLYNLGIRHHKQKIKQVMLLGDEE